MQWILCAMTSERMCIDQILLHKVCYSKCGYHFIACVHLLCSFLAISLVRLVVGVAVLLVVGVTVLLAVGVAVLDVGVAVFQARGVTVLLAVSVAILPAWGVTVLAGGVVVFLAVGVAVLLAGDVAVLLAMGKLDVRPAPLTVTTLMVYLVPLCSPVKL